MAKEELESFKEIKKNGDITELENTVKKLTRADVITQEVVANAKSSYAKKPEKVHELVNYIITKSNTI